MLRAASKIARCGEGRSLGGVQRQIRCASAIDNVRNGNFDGESPCGGTSWRRTDPKETARSRCGRDVPGLVTGAGPRAAATAYATPAMQRPVPYVRPLPWGGANKHTAQAPAVRGVSRHRVGAGLDNFVGSYQIRDQISRNPLAFPAVDRAVA